MRERWARTLALLTGSLVLLLSIGFSLAQNATAPAVAATAQSSPPAPATAPPTANTASGRQIYDELGCARCHSVAGQGSPRSPLDGVGSRLPAEELRQWIVGDAAIADDLSPRALSTKQAYASLPPEQLDELIAYLQSLQ